MYKSMPSSLKDDSVRNTLESMCQKHTGVSHYLHVTHLISRKQNETYNYNLLKHLIQTASSG